MDTTGRVSLFVPEQRPYFKRDFPADLGDAADAARQFLQVVRQHTEPFDVEQWVAHIDAGRLQYYGPDQAAVCAVTGVFYSQVAEHMGANPFRQFIGALGQTRLAVAIATLNVQNRRELFWGRYAPKPRLYGALAVARFAAAVNAAGGTCFLPTAYEDATSKVDLIVKFGASVAYVQVKQGPQGCRRIRRPSTSQEDEFLHGVKRLNSANGTRAIPLWASVNSEGKYSPFTLCSPESLQLGHRVASLMNHITQ